MGDINATDLTAETLATLDGQENVVLFDTAEGKKVSLQVLADYVVQKATESLLGTNQTVAAALTALNSNFYGISYVGMIHIPNGSNLNDYTYPGSFVCYGSSDTATLLNCPITGSGFNMHIESTAGGTGQYIVQTLRRTTNNTPETYRRAYNGSVWSTWEKDPTRAEVDALRFSTVVTTSASKTFNVPNSYRGVLYVTDSNPTQCGEYILFANSSGSVGYKVIAEASGLTFDTSVSNRLTLTSGAGTRNILFVNIRDTITEIA